MHFVYILRSLKTGKYYVGETSDLEARLSFHNNISKNTNSTKVGIPWELYWYMEVKTRAVARKIEKHIKSMKSVKYYESLKRYSEMKEKLLSKYS